MSKGWVMTKILVAFSIVYLTGFSWIMFIGLFQHEVTSVIRYILYGLLLASHVVSYAAYRGRNSW